MAISPRFAIRTFRIIGSIIYPAAPASNDLIWILSVKLPIDYAQKREVLPYSETGNLPMRATLVCPYVFWEQVFQYQCRKGGYEGQPGNQGNGLLGYEGHPGNQGGH
ncbi:MAG: hypothetical protein AUG08_04135 [Acidobacteria bacterium 13_1_20CM_2_55_15]|nr:MAG: hypothetical protein AUG08_04135 [Acidobacteria bacterium 13_1_20CM_2_55_15]